LRRAIDLEHWAAFRSSFDRLAGALREIASGQRGSAPASIVSSPEMSTMPILRRRDTLTRASRARSIRRSALRFDTPSTHRSSSPTASPSAASLSGSASSSHAPQGCRGRRSRGGSCVDPTLRTRWPHLSS
jgi:hypothetical protein